MKLSRRIITFILPPIYNLWSATLRYEEIGREAVERLNVGGERMVFCFWHGEIFGIWKLKKNLEMLAVISQSKDGEFLANFVERLGVHVVRGSSSRGGLAALRGAVRAMKSKNLHPGVTIDGPRGPKHKIKDGVFFMAHYGDAWVVPVRSFYLKAIRLGSWDNFFIPLPFTKVRVVFGEPYKLEDAKLDAEALARQREKLAGHMAELEKYLPETLKNR